MRKLSIGLIVIAIVVVGYFVGLEGLEQYIESETVGASYCDVKTDCVALSSQSPFGCYDLVNSEEVDGIKKLRAVHKKLSLSRVTYECINQPEFNCIENQCIYLREE